MSTLMSTDMSLGRPSSRVVAPPGGRSSITFGSDAPLDPVHHSRGAAPVKSQAPLSAFAFANVSAEPALTAQKSAKPTSLADYSSQAGSRACQGSSLGALLAHDSSGVMVPPSGRLNSARGHSSDSSIGDMLGGQVAVTARYTQAPAHTHRSTDNPLAGGTMNGSFVEANVPLGHHHRKQPNASEEYMGDMLGGGMQSNLVAPVERTHFQHCHHRASGSSLGSVISPRGTGFDDKSTPSKKAIAQSSQIGGLLSGSQGNVNDDVPHRVIKRGSSGGGASTIVIG